MVSHPPSFHLFDVGSHLDDDFHKLVVNSREHGIINSWFGYYVLGEVIEIGKIFGKSLQVDECWKGDKLGVAVVFSTLGSLSEW